MVKDTGKTPRVDTFKPVNLPQPVRVEESLAGLPARLKTSGWQKITAIEDRWRIDDEWWRTRPVSRLYYAVILASGQRLVIYRDLTDKSWYHHQY